MCVDVEAGDLGDAVGEVGLQPARALARERGDDHLVVGARVPGLVHGDDGIGVADHALGVEAGIAPARERLVEPALRLLAAGEAVAGGGHQQRGLDRAALAAGLQRVEQVRRGRRDVGDDKDTNVPGHTPMLLPEGQLHQGRGHAAVTDGHGVAGRRLAAHDREADRPERGGDDGRAEAADHALAEPQLVAGRGGLGQPQAAQVAVGLAAVEEARDRLLADVATLGEGDGALVERRPPAGSRSRRGRAP